MNPVNLLADLEDFVHDHRSHGPDRRRDGVTREDAELDLLEAAFLN
jgi:hypothetical protein